MTCSSNQRQFGIAYEAYTQDFKGVYPEARPTAKPFAPFSFYPVGHPREGEELPELADAMSHYLDKPIPGNRNTVYACPDDKTVFDLASNSYAYSVHARGETPQDILARGFVQSRNLDASDIAIQIDLDGEEGGSEFVLLPSPDGPGGTVTVPKRHFKRNILFADGHVGFDLDS